MERSDFAYTIETPKSFDEAVRAVEEGAAKAGFRVQHVHDVQATLAEKGFQREPFKIVEICNSRQAQRVLSEEMTAGIFMPCKVNVYTKDGRTILETMLPRAIAHFFPGEELAAVAAEVDASLRQLVDGAK